MVSPVQSLIPVLVTITFQTTEDPEEARYDFDFVVQDDETGTDFTREEAREGDLTQGSYSILLPDGRLQTVTYFVDGDSGFVAEVSYEGEAVEEEEEDTYEPPKTYSAPRAQRRHRKPQRLYEQPKQTYEQPHQTYEQPHQTYEQPHQTYDQPLHGYEHPHLAYE